MPLLEVKDVSVRYDRALVLSRASLAVERELWATGHDVVVGVEDVAVAVHHHVGGRHQHDCRMEAEAGGDHGWPAPQPGILSTRQHIFNFIKGVAEHFPLGNV